MFDSLIANPGRLKILASLVREERQDFVALRERSGLTDGNLASHSRRLASAGFIAIEKNKRDGKPVTTISLTRQGRSALECHVAALMQALRPVAMTACVSAEIVEEDWIG